MPQSHPAVWLATLALLLAAADARAQSADPASGNPRPPTSQFDRVPKGLAAPENGQPAQPAQPTPNLPRIRVGVLAYLAFQAGDPVAVDSVFLVKRSYINVEADILPYLSARVTPDVYADDDGIELRLKYAYAELRGAGNHLVTRPVVRFGMVPTPWFMFEEQVNRYRMQDPMFIERSEVLNSADTGVTVSGLFGGRLPDEVAVRIGNHGSGRYGSFAFGVYNGGGYTGRELNTNKVFQARVTGRPLPDVVPWLQASWFTVKGAGNTPTAPDWTDNLLLVSWEHPRVAATMQWANGRGDQSGSRADPGTAEAWPHEGWSAFAEGRFGDRWSVIGRFDDFNADTRTEAQHFRRVISGLAYHLSGNNRVLADVDHRWWLDGDRPGETRVQVTLQIAF